MYHAETGSRTAHIIKDDNTEHSWRQRIYEASWKERALRTEPQNEAEIISRLGDRHRNNEGAKRAAVALMEAGKQQSPEFEALQRGWAVFSDWRNTPWPFSTTPGFEGDMIPVHYKDQEGVEKVLDLMGIEAEWRVEILEGANDLRNASEHLRPLSIMAGRQSTPIKPGGAVEALHLSVNDQQTTVDFVEWVRDLTLQEPRLGPEMKRLFRDGKATIGR